MADKEVKKEFTKKAGKDKYLMVAINQIIEDYGWVIVENHFAENYFNFIYRKQNSFLEKIEIKAYYVGNHLDMSFIGYTGKKSLMSKIFDFNVIETTKRFDLNKYVSDEMQVLNKERLRNIISVVIKELEQASEKKSNKSSNNVSD
ncbi:hypothetical protein [Methanosalsum natronophilum]|uniref:Uncharacterized protein n=1 Tax=Methanosalsum natronophilum TaxID=768733 RepID=A0A424YYF1_9EURY|nr:hypothetical protein [Methanosalsum natronophilum]MCS3923101.1 hypothetical protein [Methanosalsum natronophilum]RQD85731.1 MAG: hypothetical protein D5R95_04350 [Methanosalsum natronophilum]